MATRIGYGQVEPNHLSGIVTGNIYAQLPIDNTNMGTVIEQGRFAKYDYANGKVDTTGAGPWMMIYNEEKLYDERQQSHKDYAMKATGYTQGVMTPRLIEVQIGDIFTTNTLNTANNIPADSEAAITIPDYTVGNTLKIGSDGYLTSGSGTGYLDPTFTVVKVYTMPDGQYGVKLQRTA